MKSLALHSAHLSTTTEPTHDHPTRRLQLRAASPYDRGGTIAHLHVSLPACQRRTGAVISNQARFRREQVTLAGKTTAWMRTARKRQCADLSFLSDMRFHRLLGERRISWEPHHCHRQLRRSKFPRADHRGVGGVTPFLGFVAARHAAQARGEEGLILTPKQLD